MIHTKCPLKDRGKPSTEFLKDGKPVCKIKRSDFGLKWPMKE